MIRFLFIRLILPLLLFLVLRYVFKTVSNSLKSTAGQPQPRQAPPPIHAGGELRKDPVCGTYVSPEAAIARTVKGETVYFCSNACRDRYTG